MIQYHTMARKDWRENYYSSMYSHWWLRQYTVNQPTQHLPVDYTIYYVLYVLIETRDHGRNDKERKMGLLLYRVHINMCSLLLLFELSTVYDIFFIYLPSCHEYNNPFEWFFCVCVCVSCVSIQCTEWYI